MLQHNSYAFFPSNVTLVLSPCTPKEMMFKEPQAESIFHSKAQFMSA